MSGLQRYLAQLIACHQAAAAKIMELYQQANVTVEPTDDGVRLLWRGAHMLHQEFGSTEQIPQPVEAGISSRTWRQICQQSCRKNEKRR